VGDGADDQPSYPIYRSMIATLLCAVSGLVLAETRVPRDGQHDFDSGDNGKTWEVNWINTYTFRGATATLWSLLPPHNILALSPHGHPHDVAVVITLEHATNARLARFVSVSRNLL
jgi:hypothetical protein